MTGKKAFPVTQPIIRNGESVRFVADEAQEIVGNRDFTTTPVPIGPFAQDAFRNS